MEATSVELPLLSAASPTNLHQSSLGRILQQSPAQVFEVLALACLTRAELVPFFLLPACIIAYLVLGYFVLLLPGELFKALVDEAWSRFYSRMGRLFLLVGAAVIVRAARGALRDICANILRLRIASAIHDKYLSCGKSKPFYAIRDAPWSGVDNPDQRIVADVRSFADAALNIVGGGPTNDGGAVEGIASVTWYSFSTLTRAGFFGLIIAYLWSGLVTLITMHVVKRVSETIYIQEALEADLRFLHVDVRVRAEEIAFSGGGEFEKRAVDDAVVKAVQNRWSVIRGFFLLNFVQHGFSYYMTIVMYGTIALAILAKISTGPKGSFSNLAPGEKARWISQTSAVFLQLLYSFTMLVNLGTFVSSFLSNTERVYTLLATLHAQSSVQIESDNDYSPNAFDTAPSPGAKKDEPRPDAIVADSLVVELPNGSRAGPVSFTVGRGERVLLEGPTGTGKTSVLRVMRGLWVASEGHTSIPGRTVFLPQRPCIPPGMRSMREIVLYPENAMHSSEETARVMGILRNLQWKINDSCELDELHDWSATLSPGQAQILAAARLLNRRPSFGILDEPSSALDKETESIIFRAFREANIALLTVGHRLSLRDLHDRVVVLPGSSKGTPGKTPALF